ncbi:MAG: ABC transporter ATP-binding protein [Candidatus Bipolaricaulia bacterium]
MLEVDRVLKQFGGIKAVNNCSLEVETGTITGLIGPNGAGKTTLFNLITGFFSPDSGKILFNGERIDGLSPYRIFHKNLYRTFQISRELQMMTVLENLMLIPADQSGERIWNSWFRPNLVKREEREIQQEAMEVLEFIELDHLKDEYAKNLSGGQKKLLEMARTMMAEPEMVLLDEPGAGINPTLMKKLTRDIEKLKEKMDTTFFLIEHDMDLVMDLCNPIIVMAAGQKLAEGNPEEIKQNPEVIDAYLGGGEAVGSS